MSVFDIEKLTHMASMNDVFTPLLSTDGEQLKTWQKKNDEFWLEKKASNKRILEEISIFELAKRNGILCPEYEYEHYNVPTDYGKYAVETIIDGVDIIYKKALTSNEKYLMPVFYYACEKNIKTVFETMCANMSYDRCQIEDFADFLVDYQKQNKYVLDTRNFGFLIDNNHITPAIWSALSINSTKSF